MIVFESRKVRYVIGRLERGERIHEAIRQIAEEHGVATAWVEGLGAVHWAEVCEYDQEGQAYKPARRIDAPCEILALTGNVAIRDGAPFAHLHVTLSRELPDRIEVIGGHLVAAEAFACELRLEVHDDVALQRTHDAATGLALFDREPLSAPARAPERPAPAPAGRPGALTWADVAVASEAPRPAPPRRGAPARVESRVPSFVPEKLPERRRRDEEEVVGPEGPKRGDYVDHHVFGLCRVEGEDSEGSLVIRLPSGARKPIKLDVLDVLPARDDADGKRVHPLRPRRRV